MSNLKKASLIGVMIVFLFIQFSLANNKYSKEANNPDQNKLNSKKTKPTFSMPEDVEALRSIEKPFRMQKLNMVWAKARHRLTDPKIQSLFSDLHLYDKEAIAFKHYRADSLSDGGLGEAQLRKKLIEIMDRYGLLQHFEELHTLSRTKRKVNTDKNNGNIPAPGVFKNKKLDELWAKAERSGFTPLELETLKEEFSHHQDKVDEYMSLLGDLNDDPSEYERKHINSLDENHDIFNDVEYVEDVAAHDDVSKTNEEYAAKHNMLKEKHLEIRSGFEYLEQAAAKGPKNKEFVDPKVQELWLIAKEADFSDPELRSLKDELLHYESRLLKLRHLHTQAALEKARGGKNYEPNGSNYNQIKMHTKDISKMHYDLETRIMSKHEL